MKSKLLEEEKLVDIVVGPDAYRSLPALVVEAEGGHKAVNVLLSRDETYGDISPVRLNSNGVNAFVSIMRGCNNMCSFCVVPFTRGRERSRSAESIIAECTDLFEKGYREVTLLGQNVDSYYYTGSTVNGQQSTDNPITFANLLESVALISPLLRVRFSTSHPKDITDDVMHTIARYENICNYVHLPVQSGSTTLLEKMNRGYTREQYIARLQSIKNIIPDCGISTDLISGFCTETEDDHKETLSLMEWAEYDFAYMFTYSERPGTMAARNYKDDIEEPVKKRRLAEILELQQKLSAGRTKRGLGKIHRVLVEGESKKSADYLYGRNSQNTVVVFPKGNHKKGEYVNVKAESCTLATLIGRVVL